MTPHAPTPASSSPASTRVRVKWENVMIVLIGVVVAAFACVAILIGGSGQTKPEPKPPASHGSDHMSTDATPAPAEEGALSIEDARGLVDEARTLMVDARWDEAAERLALVPEDLRELSGASTLQVELTTVSEQHEQLRAQIEATVEARRWKDADRLLRDIAAIAPLDQPLLAYQAVVDEALNPTPVAKQAATTPAATKPAKDATTATTGGDAAGATTDQSATTAKPKPKPKPAGTATTTRPKPATTPGTGTQPAVGATPALPADLLDGLSPAEQAELEQALDSALGDIQ